MNFILVYPNLRWHWILPSFYWHFTNANPCTIFSSLRSQNQKLKVKTGSLQQRSLKAIFPPLIALLCAAGCVSVVVRENIVCESGFRTAAAAFATDIQSQRRGNAAAPNGILSSTWAAASGISSFLTLLAARKERTVLSHQPSNCSQLSFSWDAEKACYSERITEGKFIFCAQWFHP